MNTILVEQVPADVILREWRHSDGDDRWRGVDDALTSLLRVSEGESRVGRSRDEAEAVEVCQSWNKAIFNLKRPENYSSISVLTIEGPALRN